jgi:hypothetical protein
LLNIELPFVASTQYIIGTDYSNFAVVQQCNNFFLFHIQFVWAFSRNPIPSPSTILSIEQTLTAKKIAAKDFLVIDQVTCPLNRV